MRKNKTITLARLIATRLILYMSLGLLLVILFNLVFGHIWGYVYTSQHWQQLPNPEFMHLELADYDQVSDEELAHFEATIEVVDGTLTVIDERGGDSRLGYQYSLSEFISLFVETDPNMLVRSGRTTLADGSDVTIILRQPLSMPPYVAFEQMAKVYAIVLVVSSLVIMTIFMLLAVRAIYKPLHQEMSVINDSIAKVPYDPSPVAEEQFGLVEMRASISTYNTMLEEMAAMRQEKEALVEQNYRLVSNLSHDLKSPMTTLKGYAELLEQDDLPPEEQKRCLGYIASNVTALNAMVEMLFEHVRFQHNDYALQLEERDMNSFLRDICANYYTMLDKLGFDVEIEIMEEPCVMVFDAINMRRVYANLLENIMSHNDAPTRVQIASQAENGWYVAAFKDDGAGIGEKERELVFEPYFQGDTSRTTQHSGLGLYVVKQIVEKHGGTIRITHEAAYKTVFEIRLPIVTKT